MSFRVDEDGIGPGFGVRSRAAQRLLLTEAGDERLGAGDHQEPRVAAGGGRPPPPPGVLFPPPQIPPPPRGETAPLGGLLVPDADVRPARAPALCGGARGAYGPALARFPVGR